MSRGRRRSGREAEARELVADLEGAGGFEGGSHMGTGFADEVLDGLGRRGGDFGVEGRSFFGEQRGDGDPTGLQQLTIVHECRASFYVEVSGWMNALLCKQRSSWSTP